MQRYSLYIDHQLVSQLIKELENIVKVCYQQLDQQYQTYELRTSIYEQFVFQVTALFNSHFDVKQELPKELKDEEIQKFFQLTTKLEGFKSDLKLDASIIRELKQKKGRPSKKSQTETKFVDQIKGKIATEGKLKFTKKQLDEVYRSLSQNDQKKNLQVNFYLRLFKKFDLRDVAILTTKGKKERTIKDLRQSNNGGSQKKEEESFVKSEFVSGSEFESNPEIRSLDQNDLESEKDLYYGTSSSENITGKNEERVLRSTKREVKESKRKQKWQNFQRFFDEDSKDNFIDSNWNDMLSMSNEFMHEMDKREELSCSQRVLIEKGIRNEI